MTKAENLPVIQYLRALAALAVAIGHITAAQALLFRHQPAVLPELIGFWGVDIFFVISGFIMAYITASVPTGFGSARQFWRRRLIRIVPAYWFFTLVIFVFTAASWRDLLRSLFFVKVNGFPILMVGWTLNFEMFFYVLFGMVLTVCPPARRIVALSLVLLALPLLGWILPDGGSTWRFFTNPLLLEFLAGVLIAAAYLHSLRLPRIFILLSITGGFAALVLVCIQAPLDTQLQYRAAYWGIPAVLLVSGFVSLDLRRRIAWLAWLGDISYSIYLSHIIVGSALALLLKHFLPAGIINPVIPFVVLFLPLTIAVSAISHRLIETQFKHWLMKRIT